VDDNLTVVESLSARVDADARVRDIDVRIGACGNKGERGGCGRRRRAVVRRGDCEDDSRTDFSPAIAANQAKARMIQLWISVCRSV
jgi:hypothetical protein